MVNAMDLIKEIFFCLGMVFIIVALAAHYFEVLPVLYKRKAIGLLNLFLNHRRSKELEKYKQVCIDEGRSLFWYNYLRYIPWYVLAWLIVGMLLMSL